MHHWFRLNADEIIGFLVCKVMAVVDSGADFYGRCVDNEPKPAVYSWSGLYAFDLNGLIGKYSVSIQ